MLKEMFYQFMSQKIFLNNFVSLFITVFVLVIKEYLELNVRDSRGFERKHRISRFPICLNNWLPTNS